MGLPACQPVHARHRDGPHRGDDPRQAPPRRGRSWHGGLRRGLIAALALATAPAAADTLRIATFHADLSRDGPGLLLRDLRAGDAQTQAAIAAIDALGADALLLTGIDWDHGLAALSALNDRLAAPYPHLFAARPNRGMATGLDLDGDGRLGGPGDAQGRALFTGQDGMAILSRLPVDTAAFRDFSALRWADLPGHLAPPGTPPEQRLSTTAHWEVPLILPGGGRLRLLAWAATPPAFDGPEDRNGRRNHDEAAFWVRLLDGALPLAPPEAPFVLLGEHKLDPADGDGRPDAIRALLAHPALRDPAPRGPALAQDAAHRGDPALDTALYAPPLGALRMDVVLPSADLSITAAGLGALTDASRHRPVWVDITPPAPPPAPAGAAPPPPPAASP
jgi:hypothetical protein